MGILRLLGRNNSGEIARKRLKLLLASDNGQAALRMFGR